MIFYFPDADPASVAFRRVHNLKEDNITVVNQVRIFFSKLGILGNIINQLKTVSNHFVLYLLFYTITPFLWKYTASSGIQTWDLRHSLFLNVP